MGVGNGGALLTPPNWLGGLEQGLFFFFFISSTEYYKKNIKDVAG